MPAMLELAKLISVPSSAARASGAPIRDVGRGSWNAVPPRRLPIRPRTPRPPRTKGLPRLDETEGARRNIFANSGSIPSTLTTLARLDSGSGEGEVGE